MVVSRPSNSSSNALLKLYLSQQVPVNVYHTLDAILNVYRNYKYRYIFNLNIIILTTILKFFMKYCICRYSRCRLLKGLLLQGFWLDEAIHDQLPYLFIFAAK